MTPSTTTVSDKYPYKINHPTPIPLDAWDTRRHITYKGSTYNQYILNDDPAPFSPEHPDFDIEEEYAKEIRNPYSGRFDEYKQVFNNKVEHLSNEYNLRIRKKGYVLDDVWEKCEQYHRIIIDPWHDKSFKEDELWRSGDEKTDYEPPYVDIKTFEVKKFKAMIRKELKDKGVTHDET
ncbi:hypothetical protein Tco_0708823 [Tanacetum coccineum]